MRTTGGAACALLAPPRSAQGLDPAGQRLARVARLRSPASSDARPGTRLRRPSPASPPRARSSPPSALALGGCRGTLATPPVPPAGGPINALGSGSLPTRETRGDTLDATSTPPSPQQFLRRGPQHGLRGLHLRHGRDHATTGTGSRRQEGGKRHRDQVGHTIDPAGGGRIPPPRRLRGRPLGQLPARSVVRGVPLGQRSAQQGAGADGDVQHHPRRGRQTDQ